MRERTGDAVASASLPRPLSTPNLSSLPIVLLADNCIGTSPGNCGVWRLSSWTMSHPTLMLTW
jgi:hypothetical protein